MTGLEQISAEQWSAAYSAAMLNAAATATATSNVRSQPPQFGGIASSPITTSGSSPHPHHPHHPPTSHHHPLHLLQTQAQQEESAILKSQQAAAATAQAAPPYNLMTVGALLKMQNSATAAAGSVVGVGDVGGAGVSKPAGNNDKGTATGVKNGQNLCTLSAATTKGLSGTPSPPSTSATLAQHLQDPVMTKLGSPSTPSSAPQAPSLSALASKRPAPIQIGPGGNRLIDETVGGVAAPTTPASPYTGQQGW